MKIYFNISTFFCIWAAVLFFLFFISFHVLPKSGLFPNQDFLHSLANWDGGHYLGIADGGYDESFQYAFFPLYPLLINVTNYFTKDFLVAALIVSFASSLLAINFLYQLVKLDFNKNIAQEAVLALLFFPASFYFLTVYNEGLFLFLVVATFLYLRKGNLILATIFAALASATRVTGLAVILGLWAQVFLTSDLNRKSWVVLLAPLGFLAYSFFLFQNTGDPFYFVRAENYWQRSLTIPGLGFFTALRSLSLETPSPINVNILLDLLFAVFAVGMAFRVTRYLPIGYSVFSLAAILIPLFTPTLLSMPRFTLVVFPIFITIALIKNPYFKFVYKLLGLLLLAFFSTLFINGYWVS